MFVCLVILFVFPLCNVIVTCEIAKRSGAEEKFRGPLEAAPDAMVGANQGGEVLEEIKESPPLKSIHVVTLTTPASDAVILRSYRFYANR